MRHIAIAGLCAGLLAGCGEQPGDAANDAAEVGGASAGATLAAAAIGPWGVDYEAMDTSVRPQDDFYRFVNGAWLDTFEIPADRANYGAFTKLAELSEKRVRGIIEEAAQADAAAGSEQQKVGDFYASFMDEARAEELGGQPIAASLAAIDAAADKEALAGLFADGFRGLVSTPIGGWVDRDFKDTTQYIPYMTQSGLGLPDRDYYLKDDEKFVEARGAYVDYIANVFALAGIDDGAAKAKSVLALETRLAQDYWSRAERRDREKTYNKVALADLPTTAPGFPWARFLDGAGLGGQDSLIVREPSAFAGFAKTFADEPLDVWKNYLKVRTITAYAPYLSADFVEASFDLYGRTLNGTPELRDRWKRGVSLIDNNLGEAVGKLYVQRYFPPEAKAGMDALVANLIVAFEQRIKGLEWMGEDTKQEALAKLAKFTPKIGYPEKWRDYSALRIDRNDLVGNVRRAAIYETEFQLGKLGGPVDPTEWLMTPQTVNAYYLPSGNEIVFPAAILQPPFFDLNADPAVNYGAIGAVIGHEIGHGFDDQGRKTDGDGLLRDWWTEEDNARFQVRAGKLADQYSQFEPIEGMTINGQLTLGENIGDLGGLTVAYHAYRLSLGGEEAPVIDGYTGDQRFFMSWAQVWRRKFREENLRQRLVTGPHSPDEYRTTGIVRNMDAWYAAFDVKPGDAMYLPAEERVRIW